MPTALELHREEIQSRIDEAKKLLAFNENYPARYFRREGAGPEIDITNDINNDHRKLIESYTALIRTIDEMIAQGR
ncbi:hypothetical protein [Neorhizobium sp. DT-125]|uniref:hypothetical protein n=1 Tax=Neorhizobium sp. DT-125 TaxID=3396163 RepID=UPI003F1AC2B3